MSKKPPMMDVQSPGDEFLDKVKNMKKDACAICGKPIAEGESSYILTIAGVPKTSCKECFFKKATPEKSA
ncbi:MAG: hypothetical protein ACTSUE_20520 [Promethearchaeota archaeon]